MLSNRALLIRQLQEFFETHLRGRYSWFDVQHRTPEKADKLPGRRQLDKELVAIDFGDYSITVQSPDDVPPLGRIVLYNVRTAETLTEILDAKSWDRIAEKIKSPDTLKERENVHG